MNRTVNFNRAPVASLKLNQRRVHRIVGSRPGTKVSCEMGVLWVTQTGDRRDYILLPGDQFTVSKHGSVLIEAMQEASLQIGAHKRGN
jgi:hypothetical protein